MKRALVLLALLVATRTFAGPVEDLNPKLEHFDPAVRREAAKALGDLLKNTDSNLRLAALKALQRIDGDAEPALPALKAVLDDPSPKVREEAVQVLLSIRKPAVPVLIEALKGRQAELRERAANVLAWIGSPAAEATPHLIEMLDDGDKDVRARAARVLCSVAPRDKSMVPALVKVLKDANPNVQGLAVKALRRLGPDAADAVPLLIEKLGLPPLPDGKTDSLVLEASAALVRIGAPAAKPLAEALSHTKGVTRDWARKTLLVMGPAAKDAIPALLADYGQADEQTRKEALRAMVNVGPAGVASLRAGLRSKDDASRHAAILVLGQFGPEAKDAVPELVMALEDRDPVIRTAAVQTLGKIASRPKDSVPALAAILDDEEEAVSLVAITSLASFGPDAAPLVEELSKRLKIKDPKRGRLLVALVALMEKIGEPAVPALVLASNDVSLEVRLSAITALGRLGARPKESLPALRDAFLDKDLREAAIVALRAFGPQAKEALPELTGALEDKSGSVRYAALETLRLLGPAAAPATKAVLPLCKTHPVKALETLSAVSPEAKALAVPELAAALEDGSEQVRDGALEALRQLGPAAAPATQAILPLLKTRPAKAAETLAAIGPGAKAAIPELLAGLEDKDHGISFGNALPRMGKEAIPGLVNLLQNGKGDSRIRAASLLGRFEAPDRDIIAALRKTVLDPTVVGNALSVRRAAIASLAQIGSADVVPTLQEAANDQYLADEALRGLCRCAPPSVETVGILVNALHARLDKGQFRPLRFDDPAFREAMVEALVRMGDKTATVLAGKLEDGSLRPWALSVLVRIGKPATKTLQTALKHEKVEVRRDAVAALAAGGDAAFTHPLLREAANDTDEAIRRSVIAALTKPNEKPAPVTEEQVKAALRLLGSTKRPERDQMMATLVSAGKTAVPGLSEAVGSSNLFVRRTAVEVLERIGPDAKAAVPALLMALADERHDYVGPHLPPIAAAAALVAIDPKPHAGAIRKSLLDALTYRQNRTIVASAAELLLRLDGKLPAEAVAALETVVLEKGGGRQAAARLLGKAGTPEAVRALVDVVQAGTEQELTTWEGSTWRVAVEVLSALGPDAKVAIPAIREAVNDRDPRVRQAATEALKHIEAVK